jgi:inner membrane protein
MFNSTHTLAGIALVRTLPEHSLRYATITAVLAANLPDIDLVSGLSGTAAYMQYHRGITHSLIGIPILSLLLAGILVRLSGEFWKTFLLSLAAMATHPLLDFANNYGWRPFLPFDPNWYYGDTLFIIDPYLDAILLIGILASSRVQRLRQPLVWACIACAFSYIGFRIVIHHHVRTLLDAFSVDLPNQQKSAVLPQMMNPFAWEGIIQTDREVIKLSINALAGVKPELTRLPRSRGSEMEERAANTASVRAFNGFARFPVSRVRKTAAGYRVTFLDFRYYDETTASAFAAQVDLDDSLNIMQDSLGFRQSID